MNDIMNFVASHSGAPLTMSSREIADMTGKEHKNVLADIRSMLEKLGQRPADFSADLQDSYGRPQVAFNLPKRECLILVSGYSVELRAKVVDRWEALESGRARPMVDAASLMTEPERKLSLLESAMKRGLISSPTAEREALRVIGIEPAVVPEAAASLVPPAAPVVARQRRQAAPASARQLTVLTLSDYGRRHAALPSLRVSMEEAEEWIAEGHFKVFDAMRERGYLDANGDPTAKARNLREKGAWKLKALLGALGLAAR